MKKILIISIVVLFIACIMVNVIPKQDIEESITSLFSSIKETTTKIKLPQAKTTKKSTHRRDPFTKPQELTDLENENETLRRENQTLRQTSETEKTQETETKKQSETQEVKQIKRYESRAKLITPEEYYARQQNQQQYRYLSRSRIISPFWGMTPRFGRMWGGMRTQGYYQPRQDRLIHPNSYRSRNTITHRSLQQPNQIRSRSSLQAPFKK